MLDKIINNLLFLILASINKKNIFFSLINYTIYKYKNNIFFIKWHNIFYLPKYLIIIFLDVICKIYNYTNIYNKNNINYIIIFIFVNILL